MHNNVKVETLAKLIDCQSLCQYLQLMLILLQQLINFAGLACSWSLYLQSNWLVLYRQWKLAVDHVQVEYNWAPFVSKLLLQAWIYLMWSICK